MYLLVQLTNYEREKVCSIASKLASFHEVVPGAQQRQTEIGLIAEASVVKAFNDVLRYRHRIVLNTKYNERGGDGGFDFVACGLTCDVKFCMPSEGVPIERLVRSNAQIIILVSVEKKQKGVAIHGFVPRERFISEGHSKLMPENCIPLENFKQLFPTEFLNAIEKPFKRIPTRNVSSFMSGGRLDFKIG